MERLLNLYSWRIGEISLPLMWAEKAFEEGADYGVVLNYVRFKVTF